MASVVLGGRALYLRAGAIQRWCRGCVGQSVDVQICVPFISICCWRGRTCVSLWRWGIGVICVQPIAIRSAIFWVICSLCMCVVSVSGCTAGCAYVSMGLMYCLYTKVMSSLDCSNVLLVSAWRTLSRVFALVFTLSVCGENLIFFVICHSERGEIVGLGYGYVG